MDIKLQLLKLLLNNELYIKYRKYISITKNDPRETQYIYKNLDILQEEYRRSITIDELEIYLLNTLTSEKEKDVYRTIFTNLKTISIGEDLLKDLLLKAKKNEIISKIALTSFDIIEGRTEPEQLQLLFDSLETTKLDKEIEQDDDFITDDLEQLYQGAIQTPGLRWRLKCLNQSLGSLRRGDFGFIFARPETGKTTFLASEITYMASQTDRPIIWFNNEEDGKKVKLRLMQGALGYDLSTLIHNRPTNQQRYLESTNGVIKLRDRASIHRREVEQYCERHTPALVVFDQIDKIKGFDGERDDLKHGAIYQWARELSKEYAPIIGVCQADASGEGTRWLEMNNVALAKTAKQAEADFIIGIGKIHDPDYQHVRFLNIIKNKLIGDFDSDPTQRHGRFTISIDPTIARYNDI